MSLTAAAIQLDPCDKGRAIRHHGLHTWCLPSEGTAWSWKPVTVYGKVARSLKEEPVCPGSALANG